VIIVTAKPEGEARWHKLTSTLDFLLLKRNERNAKIRHM